MNFIIEVFYKRNIFDAFGHQIERSIEEIGIKGIDKVKVSDLYSFDGDISLEEVKEIAENILLDKVSQKYSTGKRFLKKRNVWIVEVWYKQGVTDPVAETTKKAIYDYGLKKEVNISTGKKYYIYGNFNKNQIKKICERLLVNSLIHNYRIGKGE